MHISRHFDIFLISCLLIFHTSAESLQSTLCGLDDIEINCELDSTWAFDDKAKKCYRVIPGKEPCGYFEHEEACIQICLTEEEKIKGSAKA